MQAETSHARTWHLDATGLMNAMRVNKICYPRIPTYLVLLTVRFTFTYNFAQLSVYTAPSSASLDAPPVLHFLQLLTVRPSSYSHSGRDESS
jgi:hypothetical protein